MTRGTFRIGIGGIAIECCTFSPLRTQLPDFEVLRDATLLERYPTLIHADGLALAPTLFAQATPGGPVERATYDTLKGEFLAALRHSLPLDGLYLEMHGAMFVEGMEDAEADWIGAARDVVGPDCLISASYDLHGNLSPGVVAALDIVTAYRTAPHEDAPETRARAIGLLLQALRDGQRPHLALATIPVLLPGERVMTTQEPARSLYGQIPAVIESHGLLDASILVGFAWSDEPARGGEHRRAGIRCRSRARGCRPPGRRLLGAARGIHAGRPCRGRRCVHPHGAGSGRPEGFFHQR